MNTNMNKRRADGINQMLEKSGGRYRVFYHEPIKNGVCKPAFALQSTTQEFNLSPNVYLDEELLAKSDEELVRMLGDLYENTKGNIDTSVYLNPAYVKMNIQPRLIPGDRLDVVSGSDVVCRSFLDLTETLFLPINREADGYMSIQMTHAFLDAVGLDEQDAFQYALWNVVDDMEINTIGEAIAGITGIEYPTFGPQILVMSNKAATYGAALMLNGSALELARSMLGTEEILILPSSLHEVLCCGLKPGEDVTRYQEMVASVNDSTLTEDEILSYSVYRWDGQELTIA